jgi:hypothetical protein
MASQKEILKVIEENFDNSSFTAFEVSRLLKEKSNLCSLWLSNMVRKGLLKSYPTTIGTFLNDNLRDGATYYYLPNKD